MDRLKEKQLWSQDIENIWQNATITLKINIASGTKREPNMYSKLFFNSETL